MSRLREFFLKYVFPDAFKDMDPEYPIYNSSVFNGHICEDNTTTTPLGIGGVFDGPWQDTLNYNTITIGIIADQDSATDGLVIQWSADGATVTQTDEFSILANKGKVFTFSPANQYLSVKYTNGAVAQGVLNIQTIFKKGGFKASSHRIQDSIVADDDAELIKAVLTAEIVDGSFVNVGASDSGNLKVTDAENGLAIAKGDVVGTGFIHKFGNAPLFNVLSGFATIWDGANTAGIDLPQYVYSTTDDINGISSSDNGDTQDVAIEGLDINYFSVTQTITLTGQTKALLTTPLLRVFRMDNMGATDLLGFVYCSTSAAVLVAGTPTVPSTVRAIITPGFNQTEMAIFTIPAGVTGYMRDWYASLSGAKKLSIHQVHLEARPIGEAFKTKHVSSIIATGTSYIQHKYEEPEKFLEKTDIEMHANTDEDDAGVSAGFDIVLVDN